MFGMIARITAIAGQRDALVGILLEGLGDDEIIACPEFELFDEMIQVKDRDAFLSARELARTEAMFAGGSSGAALWATRQVAQTEPATSRIVTIFSDAGARYLSTIYDDVWMREKGFLNHAEQSPASLGSALRVGAR